MILQSFLLCSTFFLVLFPLTLSAQNEKKIKWEPFSFTCHFVPEPMGASNVVEYKTSFDPDRKLHTAMLIPTRPEYNMMRLVDYEQETIVRVMGSHGIRSRYWLAELPPMSKSIPAADPKILFKQDTNTPPMKIAGYAATRWTATEKNQTNAFTEIWLAKDPDQAKALTTLIHQSPASSQIFHNFPILPQNLSTNHIPVYSFQVREGITNNIFFLMEISSSVSPQSFRIPQDIDVKNDRYFAGAKPPVAKKNPPSRPTPPASPANPPPQNP